MAIDRIPGVGPTNADIATAVAAPSAATIAAAVAAPSAATIAAAVAAPSAATIAAAVAAPSAATIAATVAAPTIGQINTAVANNSGGSWTVISTVSPSSGNSTTFSSLSGYKHYRVVGQWIDGGQDQVYFFRLNGDTGSNYRTGVYQINNSGYDNYVGQTENAFYPSLSSGRWGLMQVDFPNANATGAKFNSGMANFVTSNGVTSRFQTSRSIWNNTAPITSITLLTNGSFSVGTWTLYGGN